jgi:drug/metabolite transporter (DMT)-like permease
MPILTIFSLVLTTLFWGGTFIAGRQLAADLSPANSSFLRFAIASLSLLIIIKLSGKKFIIPRRGQWFTLFLLGLTGIFGYNICFFTGLKYISAGRAALIIAFTPLTITMLAALFTDERLNLKQFGGILISLLGALLVISNGNPQQLFQGDIGPGEKALLGCVLSWAIYSIIGRSLLTELSPLVAVCYSSIAGTLLLAIPALQNNLTGSLSSITFSNWLNLAYLGIFGTAVGFSLYYKGIKKIGPSRTAVFINLVPFFALLLAYFLLDETIQPAVLGGGALILAGITATNIAGRK